MKKTIKAGKLIKPNKAIKVLRTFAASKFFIKFGKKKITCTDTGEVFYSYERYLKSKHWKLFKARYKKSSYYTGKCLLCYKTLRLHYHHRTYSNIGNEHNHMEDITLLCSGHHSRVHKILNRGVSWDYIVTQLKEIT